MNGCEEGGGTLHAALWGEIYGSWGIHDPGLLYHSQAGEATSFFQVKVVILFILRKLSETVRRKHQITPPQSKLRQSTSCSRR